MKIYVFTFFMLTIPFNSVQSSSLTLENTVKNLNSFIQSVSLCGQWHSENEKGRYRIIYGWLWGHTELYVQWVADPIWNPKKGQKERRTPLVIKTATFPEFNSYESATDFNNVTCFKQDGKWVVSADAENGHEMPVLKYKLYIYLSQKQGKYKLIEK